VVINCGGTPSPTILNRPIRINAFIGNRSSRIFIYTLDDDLLLSIFYCCQLAPLNVHDVVSVSVWEAPEEEWVCKHWWYKLAQVC